MTEYKEMRRIYGDKIKVYVYSVLAICAIAAILRIVALIFNYDHIIGYYNGGFLVTAMNAVCILGCLWGLSALFLLPKLCPCAKVSPRPNLIALYFCSFVFAADALYSFAGMLGSSEFFNVFDDPYATKTEKVMVVMAILGAFASLATAVYFFRRASSKPAKRLDVALGFLPLVRMLSGVFTVYFNMEVAMNSSHKVLIEWAFIMSMIFLLHENRFFAPVTRRPRAYLGFGLVAMILTASAGVGGLFSYFSGLFDQGKFCVESLICLTIFVHISASLLSYAKQLGVAEQEGEGGEAAGGTAETFEAGE